VVVAQVLVVRLARRIVETAAMAASQVEQAAAAVLVVSCFVRSPQT